MFKLLVACSFLAFLGLVFGESCDYNAKPCSLPYTKEMQTEMVDSHNSVRGNATLQASDMQKMYWSDTLAVMAQEYSDKCVFAHNSHSERRFGGYSSVGQNLYGSNSKPSVVDVAGAWYDEHTKFVYGTPSADFVGHYTQMIHSQAALIGCGAAYCPSIPHYIVNCHYLKGQDNYEKPYAHGKPCGACSSNCTNNLCDCGGKVCQQGGTLDLGTCTCNCQVNTAGVQCENFVCPQNEPCDCACHEGYCDIKYGFDTRNRCPITCKLC